MQLVVDWYPIIFDFLMRASIKVGSRDPEDVAHQVIMRALEGRVKIRSHPLRYLALAARHQTYRNSRHPIYCDLETWPDLKEEKLSAYLTLRELVDQRPKEVAFLLRYIELPAPRPIGARVRAVRIRKRLKKEGWYADHRP